MDWGHEYGFPAMSEEFPITEVTIIKTVFVTGFELEAMDGLLRLTAWEQIGPERRVVARLTMPKSAGHAMLTLLRRELGQRNNRDH